jgi:excinuclease ABC subunit C
MSTPQVRFDAKVFVESLPGRPGVYRMLDGEGQILYVGKARNLKSRVASYFQPSNVQPKVQALIAKTVNMEVTITNSDTEALLLEYNLIKKHRPRFNVVLRDDKSFPYLHLETNHEFPRLNFYRGSRKEQGKYFGARYAAAAAETISYTQLRRYLFRQSLQALSAVPDPALHGALRRSRLQGALRTRCGRRDQSAGRPQ